jgi:uncharacterized membrane protein YdjX (TVP38/TMEM64 family)
MKPALKALVKPGLLFAGLVAGALALRLLGAGALNAAQPTLEGAALLVGVGAVLAAVGVPRQAVAFAGGYAFGAWRGGALALAAQLIGCAADFCWARAVAPGWARRRLGGRLDRLLRARPFMATLTLRLLPVSSNLLLNLAAGVAGVQARAFFAASLLGYLPQTVIFALAGSGVHVGAGAKLAVGGGLFVISGLLGWALWRQGKEAVFS